MSARTYGSLSADVLASFEVDELGQDPREIISQVHPALEARRVIPSPAGYAWYGLLAPSLPPIEQSEVVGRALRVLKRAAAKGRLTDFRIVTGDYLAEMVAANDSRHGALYAPGLPDR